MNKNPNHFIEEFKIEIDKSINKQFIIEKEIKRIDAILHTNNKQHNIDLLNWVQLEYDEVIIDPYAYFNNEIKEFRIDCKTIRKIFNKYQNTGEYIFNEVKPSKEIDFTETGIKHYKDLNQQRKKEIEFVKKFSDFYNWLKELEKENSTKPKQKKSTLTHAQKILALSYLGIDMSKYFNNVQSAKILSSILDLDESNTKDYLTYFDGKKAKVKNKKNIEKMIELFEHQDFKPIQDKIKEDL